LIKLNYKVFLLFKLYESDFEFDGLFWREKSLDDLQNLNGKLSGESQIFGAELY